MIQLNSVRLRLTLWYVAVLAVGMAAFGAASWGVLRQVLLENRYRGMEQRLSAVTAFLQKEARGDTLADIAEEAREYATGLSEAQGIRLSTERGKLLFEKKPADADIFARSRVVIIRGHSVEVTLQNSLADFHRVLGTLAWAMCVVFPIVIVVAISGGWWLARRALRPVGAMTRDARQMNERDLSARLSVPHTGDELQELAEAWNGLLARIEAAVRTVKRFTADAAHELRTPVTVIRTSAEIALRQERSPDSYRQTLVSIERETVEMTDLLDQLLLLARGDAGEWKFQKEIVFVDQILRALRNAVAPLAETRKVRVRWRIPTESVMLYGDEAALRRLVLILTDNALKHTPGGEEVTIEASNSDQSVVIQVSDAGPGICPGDLPHIFDRFYRADSARTPGSGAGLGLAIARTIVDAHGGAIEVVSGHHPGSRFIVRLPMAQRPEQSPLSGSHSDVDLSETTQSSPTI